MRVDAPVIAGEGDVLIVGVLFRVAAVINLALRSNAQGRIEVGEKCRQAVLVGLSTFQVPVTIMGDTEIEDEVPRPAAFSSWR